MWQETMIFLTEVIPKLRVTLCIGVTLFLILVVKKHIYYIRIQISRFFSVIVMKMKLLENFKLLGFISSLIFSLMVIISICLYLDGSAQIMGSLIASLFFVRLTKIAGEIIFCFFEDKYKINNVHEKYLNNYGLKLAIGNHQIDFLYKPLLTICNDSDKYNVDIDHQPHYYELNSIIMSIYTKLLHVHRNDYVENFDCVRLDSYSVDEDNLKLTLKTIKIKCFDNLVTNFALDYKLDSGITLRKIFEYGCELPDLKDSQMANQIGINALVFLKDGSLLMPKRGKNATISKGMVTSSIAMAFELKNENLTSDALLQESIVTGLTERLYLPTEIISKTKVEIVFLGFGQSVVWGGKPQFYFCVWLDMDARQYVFNSINVSRKGKTIDKDKKILLVRDIELYEHSDFLKLTCLAERSLLMRNKEKNVIRVHRAENSFFCNCYHLKKCHINREVFANWLKSKLS